jgi:FKBP-type peptidyl-prolyl cis-trans isomerase 2
MTYSWYSDSQKKPKSKDDKVLLVREGDLITCHFTEYIWTKGADGNVGYVVYQTTHEDVAKNDSIPKSVTFKKILHNQTGESLTRTKLTAIAGADLIFEMNEGFNQIVIDMREGETRVKEVSIALGYGERNESFVQTIPLLDKILIYETLDRQTFESEYSNELPLEIGKTFEHHYWKWMIRINSISDETVVIKHEPEVGQELRVFDWNSTVENVSSLTGYIWISHKPTENDINTPINAEVLEFYNPIFTEIKENIVNTQQPYPGIILSIQNGIEIDFNRENIGKNLKYEITIQKIERD